MVGSLQLLETLTDSVTCRRVVIVVVVFQGEPGLRGPDGLPGKPGLDVSPIDSNSWMTLSFRLKIQSPVLI